MKSLLLLAITGLTLATASAAEKKPILLVLTNHGELGASGQPTGFFLSYTSWRRNVSGIAKGPLPFFWGVSKT
jgi:hypothetical protein